MFQHNMLPAVWLPIGHGRRNRPTTLYDALSDYFAYFNQELQDGGCNYAMHAAKSIIGHDGHDVSIKHQHVWHKYNGLTDDTFDNQIRAMTVSWDFHCTLDEPRVGDCHPIQFTMFHICTTIMFDFIVYNKNMVEGDLLDVKRYLQQQVVHKKHDRQFEDVDNFRYSVHVSALVRQFWKSLRTTYVFLSPEHKQSIWTMVCEEVACSIVACGMRAIEMDIKMNARYKIRSSAADPFYQFERKQPDPYYRYERITHAHDDSAVFSMQKWQAQPERDYTEKVFYLTYASAPLDAFWQQSNEKNATYLESYKRVFDVFRLLHFRIDNVAEHRQLTGVELRQCSIQYDRWGFAYSMRSLLSAYNKQVNIANDRQRIARAVAISEGLMSNLISLPKAYQETQALAEAM
jgi:hypothetical protein